MRPLLAQLALALVLPVAAAQEPAAQEPTEDDRLAELEARVAELEEVLYGEEEASQSEALGLGLEAHYGDNVAVFQIFGDVGFLYTDPAPPDEGNTSFFLGSVDFLINAQFGERWRFLSETVIDAVPAPNIAIDQERLWASWSQSDAFRVKFGTEHTPISRWNQLYHHGRWLETTAFRPLLARFESDGGILPMHRTGIEISGGTFAGSTWIEYFGAVSNGRGEQPQDKTRVFDPNNEKAIDLGVAFEPLVDEHLRIGVSGTHDTIPSDDNSTIPGRARSILEYITTGQIEWYKGPITLRGEIAYIYHDAYATDETYSHNAGYLQLEYRRKELTPYGRLDYRNMDIGDPYFMEDDTDLDTSLGTLGLRWDPNPNVAMKFEVSYGSRQDRDSMGVVSSEDVVIGIFQLAWWL